jgi:hypothetical protein
VDAARGTGHADGVVQHAPGGVGSRRGRGVACGPWTCEPTSERCTRDVRRGGP